jgi:hypothetical protein
VRQHGAGDGERAEQVDRQHLVDLRVRELLQGTGQPVAGVVDQHVDRARGHGRVHRRPHLVGVGDVQWERAHRVGVGVDEVGEGARIARRRDDRLAAGEEGLGEDPAEAGGGAGDEPTHAAMLVRPGLIRPRHVRAHTHGAAL